MEESSFFQCNDKLHFSQRGRIIHLKKQAPKYSTLALAHLFTFVRIMLRLRFRLALPQYQLLQPLARQPSSSIDESLRRSFRDDFS